MGVSKRSDGRWNARYRDNNGREHKTIHKREGDAKRWCAEQTAALITGTYVDPRRGRQTFHNFALEWAEGQDWKETTRQGFPMVLKRLDAMLGGRQLASIDQLTIKRARVVLTEKYAPATVTLTMTYLTGIMRAACHSGRISRDPTIGTQTRRRKSGDDGKVGPDDVPTRAEVAAIWQSAPAQFRAAIALGATGLRVGEVIGLTADRIDVEQRLVTIDRQLQRIGNRMTFTEPKGQKIRTIRVPNAVALELRRHQRDHRSEGLLFQGAHGNERLRRDLFYRGAWKPALLRAGLADDRFVFHSLRHFCASSMLAEGVNPMAVAGHLGDTLETLQRVYAHWMRDDRDVPADALDRILLVDSLDVADGGAVR